MQCDNCKAQNKQGVKICRRCGSVLDLAAYQPSWKWSLKVLLVIYALLIAGYVLLRIFL